MNNLPFNNDREKASDILQIVHTDVTVPLNVTIEF